MVHSGWSNHGRYTNMSSEGKLWSTIRFWGKSATCQYYLVDQNLEYAEAGCLYGCHAALKAKAEKNQIFWDRIFRQWHRRGREVPSGMTRYDRNIPRCWTAGFLILCAATVTQSQQNQPHCFDFCQHMFWRTSFLSLMTLS